MSRLLLLIALSVLGAIKVLCQTCDLPQHVYDAYQGDVVHLAIVEMHKQNAPELDLVEVPMEWQEPIWNGLSAVFHDQGTERDSVFDIYCVHHYSCWELNYTIGQMYVYLEENAPWESNWVSGDISTDDIFLDSILARHGFDEIQYSSLLNSFTIETDMHLNLNALATILEGHEYIEAAGIKGCYGDFSRIVYSTEGGETTFDFSIAWGDCPAGCIYRHHWGFTVDHDDCLVDEKWISGDVIADEYEVYEPNCNLTTGSEKTEPPTRTVQVIPNPFVQEVWLDDNSGVETFELISSAGVLVEAGTVYQDGKLDFHGVPPGVYVLVLYNDKRSIIQTEKLVKN